MCKSKSIPFAPPTLPQDTRVSPNQQDVYEPEGIKIRDNEFIPKVKVLQSLLRK